MDDNLLGRLGGDAAKIGDIVQLLAEIVLQLHLRVQLPGLFQGDLGLLVKDLLHHSPVLEDLDFTQLLVELHLDVTAAAILFPDRRADSLLDGVYEQGPVNALIPADLIENPF